MTGPQVTNRYTGHQHLELVWLIFIMFPEQPHVDRSVCVCVRLLNPVQLFATPWTVARQAPLSMRFPRQESWSGLPCPPPGDLPDPGIEPTSVASPALAGGFFITASPGKHMNPARDIPFPLVQTALLILVSVSIHLGLPLGKFQDFSECPEGHSSWNPFHGCACEC